MYMHIHLQDETDLNEFDKNMLADELMTFGVSDKLPSCEFLQKHLKVYVYTCIIKKLQYILYQAIHPNT